MHEVHLYMYDISKGMARTLSPMLLGTPIEGIWHTAVVVYDREHLFAGGAGIMDEAPETTPFGVPQHKRAMGTTSKTRTEFADWNRSQRREFGADSYHLLEKNCNHYSDAALRFLTGNGVPETVSNMTATIFNSPLGSIAAQFIQQMQQQMAPGSAAPSSSSPLDGSSGTSAPTSLFGGQGRTTGRAAPRAAPRPTPKYFCHMCDKEVAVTGGADEEKTCSVCKNQFVEQLEAEAEAEEVREEPEGQVEPIHPLGAILQALTGSQGNNLEPLVTGLARGIQRLLAETPTTPNARNMTDTEIGNLASGTVDASLVGEECAICHDRFAASSHATTLPCQHVFHGECITQWLRLRNNCPTCRHTV